MEVYRHNQYRDLISEWMNNDSGRGTRTRLAEAAHCSPSWITRVLNGNVHLTPDQALAIAAHLNLSDEEADYFLNLVDLERASTPALRKRIQKKTDELKSEGRKLAASLKAESTVTKEGSTRYYSSWLYSAVHVACMIKPQSIDDVTTAVGVHKTIVAETLRELTKMGLLDQTGGRWIANSNNVHLPSDHPMAKITHVSWRNRATQYLLEGHGSGFHYSAIHCLSEKDVDRIQAQLKKMILECRKVIHDSPSETLAVFCVDWFRFPA